MRTSNTVLNAARSALPFHSRHLAASAQPKHTILLIEIATASIDGSGGLLDVLFYRDLSTLIQRAEDCYEAESEQPGYLASRPLEIFAMTLTGAPREDRMVFKIDLSNKKGPMIRPFFVE
ncbi:hypothetical protein [Massilia arenae]|uniref:Uncharacterized protein n=1 Tax=Massilia arenae TaxID=2603288 RepID=A0A5C7G4D4_9BURK|nr:hypothetical protein [Massilia arenae]TXF99208.1 hypothetical protein FVD38_13530 [Massilia arenae]